MSDAAAAKLPHLLCIDDNPDWLMLIEHLLTENGFDVATAAGPAAGFAAIEQRRPDLILLDVRMAGMDGYQFCEQLQRNEDWSWIPVVFLSALEGEPDRARAFAAGGVDYLVKQKAPARVVEVVRRQLQTRIHWGALREQRQAPPHDFSSFCRWLAGKVASTPLARGRLRDLEPAELYASCADLGLTPPVLARLMAEFNGLPFLSHLNPQDLQLGVVPPPFSRKHLVVAVRRPDGPPAFVVTNPYDLQLLENLRLLAGTSGAPFLLIAEPAAILDLFPTSQPQGETAKAAPRPANRVFDARMSLVDIEAELERTIRAEDEESLQAAPPQVEDEYSGGPTIKLVDRLVDNAIRMEASDIHVEPAEDEVVIRYRIDGDLRVMHRLRPARLIHRLIARIKVMARLDIAERRLPQDGRISLPAEVDLRVSTIPELYGEKAVLRLLKRATSAPTLDRLGFSARNLALYRDKIRVPYGLILHVGPTGSGKSMTLFSALGEIRSPSINIQTIEDPIEYRLPGINQMQVQSEVQLDFSRALRSILRQDPDVILVGEIRDLETAHTAVEAANTGHLLFATLHTNDAASCVQRLVEMGIEPYLVSASLIVVCAQRLVRRLCGVCKAEMPVGAPELRLLGVGAPPPAPIFRSVGCPECDGTGFRGRIGVHELLVPNEEVRREIARRGATAESIHRLAVERAGMVTLYRDAMEKVRAGVTSIEEVLANVRLEEGASA